MATRRRSTGWRAATPVAASTALAIAIGWNVADTGAIADRLGEAYDVSLAVVGLLTSALFLAHFVIQIPAGTLVDRYGGRPVGMAGLVVIAAANALALLGPDFALALGARTLMGLGTGAAFVAGSDFVRSTGGSATLQGLYGGAAVAGGGGALAVVPAFAAGAGWRAPYVGAVVLAAAALVALALAADARGAGSAAGALGRALTLLRDPSLRPFAIVHTASFGLSVVVGNWVVPLLERDGYRLRTAGLLGSLVLLGGLVSRPAGGWVAARFPGRVRTLVGASLVLFAAGIAVLAAPAPLGVRAVAAGVAGLAAGLPFAPAFAGAQAARPDAPAAAVGLVNSAATLAILAGTPLLGLAFQDDGTRRIGFLAVAGLVAAAAAAARAFPR